MYEDTLLVFTSDNGGTQDPYNSTTVVGGSNFPLRGAKHSNWQGGMRTQTFVSGGLIPRALQGSTNNGTYHITDWYPTFCAVAGGTSQECLDDSPVQPLPVDPSNSSKDIYGEHAWPALDGTNIWPQITSGSTPARDYVWLSAQVMIKGGRYKLLTAQQDPSVTNSAPMTGWRNADGSWVDGGPLDDAHQCGVAFRQRSHFRPCLFDLANDEREENDLSLKMPELVNEIWTELNHTALTAFLSRSPASLKGKCDEDCATNHWKSIYGRSSPGPICGVPHCS
jgi:hypothetical protein